MPISMKYASAMRIPGGVRIAFAPDGRHVDGTCHDTHHYHVIAHRCGYGDDIEAYAREHDVLHELLCEWIYEQPSPILYELASGREPVAPAIEEMAVQAAQRWVRANERPIVGGVDWDAFKRHCIQILDAL